MQSFIDLALRRRSIRKYLPQQVEEEKVKQILQAALASPSSKHLNPWQFVVVTDHEVLSRMSECRTYGSQMLRESPLGIVVCVDSSLTDTWQADGAIAALNMLLAAEDLGLGGCWVQIYNRELQAADANEDKALPRQAQDLVKELLQIPEQFEVLCIVSIGYKAEEKKPINPDKLQYEKIHYGQF